MLLCHLLVLALAADPAPTITSPVGTGEKGFAGDGGPAEMAKLDQPFDVTFDKAGNLYFSDTGNHRVRKVDSKTGVITTVAGNGKKGYDAGLPDAQIKATAAMLNEPYGVELDDDGNLYIIDRLNSCIRRVNSKTSIIETIAGTGGKSGFAGDGGKASAALLVEPNGLCLDGKGKMYVADVAGHRVRVVDLNTGTIDTLIGTGKGASTGDGGPLKNAATLGPRAVALHPDGSLLLVERNGHRVRKIDLKKNTIERFAGTGKKGYSGDGGKATDATFDGPKEIDVDKDGTVYVVDTENEAIRRIDAKTGIIATVAGKGRTKTPGRGDGGLATAATLGRPHGVAVGTAGALYIGDTNSHRIRKVK